MDAAVLEKGFADLELLADAEYRQSLESVLSDPDAERSAVRIGRLVGVMLKEPFAQSVQLDQPSHRTSAYRAWNLRDEKEFKQRQGTWQYRALDQIRTDLSLEHLSVFQIAQDAQHETGFFGYFARDLRKYICGDKAIRKELDDAIKKASKSGTKLPQLSPEYVVGAGGLSLGVFLVQNVPVLGLVGAPVIAAVVLILYQLGVGAFCKWADSLRTDEDEKH